MWFLIGDSQVAEMAFYVLLVLNYDYVIFDHTQNRFATVKIPRKFFLRTIQHGVTDDRTSTKTNEKALTSHSEPLFSAQQPSLQTLEGFLLDQLPPNINFFLREDFFHFLF